MKKVVDVVGAIIENEKEEILCALRSKNMSLANFWEFPGGKIEQGETVKEAIVREIHEELDCTIEFIEIFNDTFSLFSYVGRSGVICHWGVLRSGTKTSRSLSAFPCWSINMK